MVETLPITGVAETLLFLGHMRSDMTLVDKWGMGHNSNLLFEA